LGASLCRRVAVVSNLSLGTEILSFGIALIQGSG
jgi:hypothetical protein